MSELFPIMVPRYNSELPGFLRELREAGVPAMVVGIPWSLIEPHEAQALKNHNQSLRRLADRGGLSPAEALAVLADQPFSVLRSDEQVETYRQLYDIVSREGISLAIGASPESLRLAKSDHKPIDGKLANRVQPRRSEGRDQDRTPTARGIAADRDWQITCWFLSAMVGKVMLPAQRVAAIEVAADIAACVSADAGRHLRRRQNRQAAGDRAV